MMPLLEGGGGSGGLEQRQQQQHERNEFGLSAAPMEDASHLEDSSTATTLREKGLERKLEEEGEGHEEDDLELLLRFDVGGHDERGWSRALRAATLVAECDPSSSPAGAAFVAAASSAPWLRELLEREGEDVAAGSESKAASSALRALVGALRRRLSQ